MRSLYQPLANLNFSLDIHPYSLKLIRPFKSSAGLINHRTGFILRLKGDGISAFGEAAPLPGYSKESLQEVESDLKSLEAKINIDSLKLLKTPSAQFGLSSALADLLGKKLEKPLAAILCGNPLTKIPVNLVSDRAEKILNHRTSKIKISSKNSIDVLKIAKNIPSEAVLRLDANQQFDKNTAIKIFSEFRGLAIEYVEEPFLPNGPEDLEDFYSATGLPLALDETIYSRPEEIEKWLGAKAVSAIVLKPCFIGYIDETLRLIKLSLDAGKKVVISSSFDNCPGFSACLHLAATAGENLSACGLDTMKFFEKKKEFEIFKVSSGSIDLPNGPGLGLKL